MRPGLGFTVPRPWFHGASGPILWP